MKKTKFLQQIGHGENRLYYHSLFGNLFLLTKEYINILESSNPEAESPTIAKELSNQYFLVNDNTNERAILKRMKEDFLKSLINGRNVTSLDLNVSEICNFTCPHCMNGCAISESENKLMTWEIAKRGIDEYKKIITRNGIIGEIHFGSAEPLLNWKIIQKCVSYCKKILPKTPLSINTNLSLLTKEMGYFFKENNISIATSLDGKLEGNDKIRTSKKGGTFKSIMEKINLLKDIDYPLDGISVTMNDLNIDYVDDEFVKFIKELGFTGFASDIDLVNNSNCNKDIDLYIQKLIHLYSLSKSLGLENFGSWTSVYINLTNQEPDELLTFCKAQSGRNISINPKGEVFLCGYSTSKIGDIYNFQEVFKENSLYQNLIRSRLPGENEYCNGFHLISHHIYLNRVQKFGALVQNIRKIMILIKVLLLR